MLTIFGAVSVLERSYILSHQAEGIAMAKSLGKYKGRKPKELPVCTDAVIRKWKDGQITAAEATSRIGISKSTFCRKFG